MCERRVLEAEGTAVRSPGEGQFLSSGRWDEETRASDGLGPLSDLYFTVLARNSRTILNKHENRPP